MNDKTYEWVIVVKCGDLSLSLQQCDGFLQSSRPFNKKTTKTCNDGGNWMTCLVDQKLRQSIMTSLPYSATPTYGAEHIQLPVNGGWSTDSIGVIELKRIKSIKCL